MNRAIIFIDKFPYDSSRFSDCLLTVVNNGEEFILRSSVITDSFKLGLHDTVL